VEESGNAIHTWENDCTSVKGFVILITTIDRRRIGVDLYELVRGVPRPGTTVSRNGTFLVVIDDCPEATSGRSYSTVSNAGKFLVTCWTVV
jgi:hypothetical protein